MSWLKKLTIRLRALFRKEQLEQELDEELRFHIERQIDENMATGMSPEEARYAARRAFGGVDQIKEACRDMRGVTFIESLMQDLRYGLRMLRRSPGFTTVAVLSLSLGIGANTAIFTLLDAVLLKMLPVKDPEQLVVLSTTSAGSNEPRTRFSYPLFQDLRQGNQVLSGMFVYSTLGVSMSFDTAGTSGPPERVQAELVSGDFFSTLGVKAHIGRVFSSEDDQTMGAHPVVILSYNFWQRRFVGDSSLVGRTIRVNNFPFTVIGVASHGFYGVQMGSSPDLWLPMMLLPQAGGQGSLLQMREATWLPIMARLKSGITLPQAQAALDALFQQSLQYQGVVNPDSRFHPRLLLLHGSKGLSKLRQQFSKPLIILMILVGLVLLIACGNIANLLLARAASRKKEVAVRLALGASRLRLMRQFLTESILLSFIGGILGLAFAYWGTEFLLRVVQSFRLGLEPDMRILGFTLGISLMTGILFGLAPALQATQPDLVPVLKGGGAILGGGRGRLELRKVLVMIQVVVSLWLLISAGLFVRSLWYLKNTDAGFSGDKVLMVSMNPKQAGYDPAQIRNFCTQLLERVEALPGVRSASFVAHGLLIGRTNREDVYPPGYQPRPGEDVFSEIEVVDRRFFETAGIPLLVGRDFGPQDHENGPKVAMVNEAFARGFFGAENPIGRRIGIGGEPEMEIIGVVKSAKYHNLREESPRIVYRPFLQAPFPGRTLYLRTAGDPNKLIASVRSQVLALDKNLPVFGIKTFAQQVNESLVQERLTAMLSSFFGLLALLLACVGLYGLMSYAVIRRTNEMGLRMALGASRSLILWLVLRDTLRLVLVGIVIGLPTALGAARLVSSLLFGLTPTDPSTIVGATLLLVTVAILASYLPARRATKIDPMVALRYE